MRTAHLRNLGLFSVVLLMAPACQQGQPTRPSLASALAPSGPVVVLTGLTDSYVGTASEICEDGPEGLAIHDLTVDYKASDASLHGALLVACDTGECTSGAPLGTVTECPVVPPNPCEAGLPEAISEGSAPACLTGDREGAGSVRVYAGKPADALDTWTVVAYFEGTGDASNAISGEVERSEDSLAQRSSLSPARVAQQPIRHRRWWEN